jgi:type VI secretion system protein ImpA
MYSPEELQKPPVIDLEEYLRPISEENPAGESLRYSGIYDEIKEARYADDDVAQGQWRHELKTADYRKVIELAGNALKTQTKDLQIAVWFSEALTKVNGFVGLRDSLKLVGGFQEMFWETLFPEIDEGDMEGRANALASLDKQTASAIREKPITEGEGLNWLNWEESTRFDIPDSMDAVEYNDRQRFEELKKQAEDENRVTGERWRKARALTHRVFCEETYFVLNECWAEYENLNRVIEEKFDRNQAPGLGELRKSLDDLKTQVKRLLDEKRLEEPDPEDEKAEGELAEGEVSEDGTVMVAVAGKKGPIQNRQDALKRLSEVAEYFRKNEPHSPVSYLINRAVKWGSMPLENWLQDVIKDESIISQLRQTLGFNTGSDDEESSA